VGVAGQGGAGAPGPADGPAPGADVPEAEVHDQDATAPGQGADAGELDAVRAERDEYLDTLRRVKAEFDNYRRRSERDRQMAAQAATGDLVRELLPVVDNLELAVAALGEEGEQIVAGVDMVRVQLGELLTARGVAEIEAHGATFDPQVHEAVATHPSAEHAEGTVMQVVQKGYTHGEAVIRPSRVVVAERPR
jgi:molecular chaperone GrpE